MRKGLKSTWSMFLVFTLILSLLSANVVFAKEKSVKITPNTVITKDNLYDVLNYVGLEASTIEWTNEEGISRTVEDLQEAIMNAKAQPKTTNVTEVKQSNGIVPNKTLANITSDWGESGSVTLNKAIDNGTYIITYSIGADYEVWPVLHKPSDKNYTGVGTAYVSTSTDLVAYQYRPTPTSLLGSYTEDSVTLDAEVTIDVYFSVGIAWIKVNTQNISAHCYWDNSYIPGL